MKIQLDGWMESKNRRMVGWIEKIDRYKNGRLDGYTNGWQHGYKKQMNSWMDMQKIEGWLD